MFNLQTISIGIMLLIIIYVIRALCLFLFSGRHIFPQLFLAPRGLITILLFFAIPQELTEKHDFDGVLLFIILASCLIMTWSLIKYKKEKESDSLEMEIEDVETSNTDDLLDQEIEEEDL